MFKNLTTKTLYDKRWFIIGWGIGVAAMIALTVLFFPTIKDQAAQLFENIPKSLQGIVGDSASYSTINGYVASGVFELRVPLLMLTMAIILAVALGVGEESSGRLYQLISQPISRGRIVLEKWAGFIIVVAAIHLAALVGLVASIWLIHESMALSTILSLVLMCFLLSLAAGSTVLMLGFATGRKGLAILLGSVIVFGSYLITSFVGQVEWLKQPDYFSLFHYYHAATVVKQGLSVSHVLVLFVVTVVSFLIAQLGFKRRDIGTKS